MRNSFFNLWLVALTFVVWGADLLSLPKIFLETDDYELTLVSREGEFTVTAFSSEFKNELGAVACAYELRGDEGCCASIDGLDVFREYRCHGVGRMLLTHAVDYFLKKIRPSRVSLMPLAAIDSDMTTDLLIGFYKRYGFVEFPDYPLNLMLDQRYIVGSMRYELKMAEGVVLGFCHESDWVFALKQKREGVVTDRIFISCIVKVEPFCESESLNIKVDTESRVAVPEQIKQPLINLIESYV